MGSNLNFQKIVARTAWCCAGQFFIIDRAGEANHGADRRPLLDILFAP